MWSSPLRRDLSLRSGAAGDGHCRQVENSSAVAGFPALDFFQGSEAQYPLGNFLNRGIEIIALESGADR